MELNVSMIFASGTTGKMPDRSIVGGKALNLLYLSHLGFKVPPFFVISANAFRELIRANSSIATEVEALSGMAVDHRAVGIARIRELIESAEIPAMLREGIQAEYQRLFGEDGLVAVRSSASDEDGADHSFAGMHDSFLFIRGFEDVLNRVRQVWASSFNERAIAYRMENGLDIARIAVGVVVQQMVDARTSGVIFTVNPANEKTHETVISSLWGAGEGLVSAGLPADTFIVEKKSLEFKAEVSTKTEKMVIAPDTGKGLVTLPVEADAQDSSSLTDTQVSQIAQIAQQIENTYRRPQDIEFCIDHQNNVYVVQARPITRLKEYGPAAGNRLVWDNSNIIESYSGVTTPMTFSFIRHAYTIVYHCFAEVMGISPSKVKQSRQVFENMLGLIRGRVYYNLQNWYRLIRLFPGFQYNSQFMESMMGIKEPLILDDPLPEPDFFRKWFVELPALVNLVCRGTWNFIRIRAIVSHFEANFREHYDRWDALEFDQLPPHEIMRLYAEMEETLLWNWKAPIINDFYVMIYYGLLKRFSQQWCHDPTGALQNDLICGEGGVESAEPARMLLRLASIASHSEKLRSEIVDVQLETLPERIKSNPEFDEFNQLMAKYLELYGFRCMNELKLEEYSLRDRPSVVYQVLRNYLALDNAAALDVDAMHAREQKIRHDAEATAFSSLRGFSLLPRRWIFQRVLRNARTGVKNRENMRFARTRIYGLLRELIRAIGHQMANEKIIDQPQDIFYLTIDELWDFIKGTSVTTRLNELSKLRRAEFAEFEELPAPGDRFETFGFAYHKNLFVNRNIQPVMPEDGQLRGIGCCPGTVTRRVRVLRHPSDDLSLSGEILVAERTDPGWVPLYPAVSGILIERGSILSHSAVVAREMGIPTIVGIAGLLQHVADGEVVTMDGSSGIVKLDEP